MKKTLALLVFVYFSTSNCFAQEDKAESKPSKQRLAEILFQGALEEGVEDHVELSFLPSSEETLQKLIGRIQKAKNDPEIQGMVLRADSLQIGMAKTQALQRALADFRSSGKKIHAYLVQASTKEYLLACNADEISMTPSGFLMLPGLRIELTYMKELLDWLGVQADVIHIGEFKTAFENYYRNEMSPGQKEALGAILDGFYEQIIRTISEGRKMSKERVQAAIDSAMFMGTQARARGLVDFTEYEDEFMTRLKTIYGQKLEVVEKYGMKEKSEINFSDFTAIFQMFGEMMKKPETPRGEKIAVIYAMGPIHTGKSESSAFGGKSMGSATMVKAIREAADDSNVKGIVLRINSPGGSGLASDEMWREIVRAKAKKPFVASMSDVAGSGGYYIAMAADSIVAEEGTITGSIGVIGMKLVLSGLYDKIGVHPQVIQRGKNAGIFSSSSSFNEEERSLMTRYLESFYQEFVSKVAEGRNRPFDEMEKIARGRIWTGTEAKRIGLVDELGGLEEAITIAKKKAGLDPLKKMPLLELPKPKTFMELLEDGGFPFGQVRESQLLHFLNQSIRGLASLRDSNGLLQLFQTNRAESHYFLMPFEFHWR